MSNKKKYQSIYGAIKPIRSNQYLVELIIKRRADKQNIKLPDRFWSKEYNGEYNYWTKIFGSELRHAKKLFDKYDEECIIEAFNSYDCKMVLSSSNKKLEQVIQEFQRRKRLFENAKEEVTLNITSTTSTPNVNSSKKNRLSKLK